MHLDQVDRNFLKKELISIKEQIIYKNPNLRLTNEDLLTLYDYKTKLGADILASDLCVIPFGGKNAIHVTISLQRKIAKRELKHYSMDFMFCVKLSDGTLVERGFVDKGERLVGCTAILSYYGGDKLYTLRNYILFDEYKPQKEAGIWQTKPTVMIKKVAEAGVLRMAVPEMQGMYVEEELQKEVELFSESIENNAIDNNIKVEEVQIKTVQPITQEEYEKIVGYQKKFGYTNIKTKEELEKFLTNNGSSAESYIAWLEKKVA